MKHTEPKSFDRVRKWCNEYIDADKASIKTEENNGNKTVECTINNGKHEVFLSIDEKNNGKVLYKNKNKKSPERFGYEQDWEGDVSEVDLHRDGVTMAGEQSTFSINWSSF